VREELEASVYVWTPLFLVIFIDHKFSVGTDGGTSGLYTTSNKGGESSLAVKYKGRGTGALVNKGLYGRRDCSSSSPLARSGNTFHCAEPHTTVSDRHRERRHRRRGKRGGEGATRSERVTEFLVKECKARRRYSKAQSTKVKDGAGKDVNFRDCKRKVERKVWVPDSTFDGVLFKELGIEEGGACDVIDANVAADVAMIAIDNRKQTVIAGE